MRYILQLNFLKASNNEGEYKVLIHGMRMAKACGATRLTIHGGLEPGRLADDEAV
jgi:ribonuclease HI